MRKIIILIVPVAIVAYVFLKEDIRSLGGQKKSTPNAQTFKTKSLSRPYASDPKVRIETVQDGKEIIENALLEVASVDDFEQMYFDLGISEIEKLIKFNENSMYQDGLIKTANRGELNYDQAKKLVSYMRTNQALNKILIDRQLNNMAGKYL
jgi:hypothetical protein